MDASLNWKAPGHSGAQTADKLFADLIFVIDGAVAAVVIPALSRDPARSSR
jgi:hypothetical protein